MPIAATNIMIQSPANAAGLLGIEIAEKINEHGTCALELEVEGS